jgi:hypothetical protein
MTEISDFGSLILIVARGFAVAPLSTGFTERVPCRHRRCSWLRPHSFQTSSPVLLPGAIVVGVALAAIHAFVGLALVDYLESKQETYGVLGLAAGLLLTLYAWDGPSLRAPP